MGKGTRSRKQRANATIAASLGTQTSKKSKTTLYTTVATAVVAVILLACILLTAIFSTGFNYRVKTVAQTEHFKVTAPMMSYFIYSQYEYYSQYITYFDSDFDSSKSLKSQYYDESSKTTWYDFFLSQAKSYVEQILIACEVAYTNGIELSKEQKKSVESDLDDLYSSAKEYVATYSQLGYSTSVNQYIQTLYGTKINKSDLRKAFRLETLASYYLEQKTSEIEGNITEEMINKYYDENPSVFLTADISSFELEAELEKTGEGDTATAEDIAKYEAKKAELLEAANKIAGATSYDQFREYVAEYVISTIPAQFRELYDEKAKDLEDSKKPTDEKLNEDITAVTEYISKLIKDEEVTEPEAASDDYGKIVDKIRDKLAETCQKQYATSEKAEEIYADPKDEKTSALDKWVFDDERKVGDITVIYDKTEDDTATEADGDESESKQEEEFVYTVCMIHETTHRDEADYMRNVSHILFAYADLDSSASNYKELKEADAAEKKLNAEKALEDFKKLENTQTAFEEFGKDLTDDNAVTYTDVYRGQMVEEFEDWLFDESREIGDLGIVESDYGFHVMRYNGKTDDSVKNQNWYVTAKSNIANDDYSAWYKTQQQTYNIKFNEDALGVITGR